MSNSHQVFILLSCSYPVALGLYKSIGTHLAFPVNGFSTHRIPSPQRAHLHPQEWVGGSEHISGQGGCQQGTTLHLLGGGQKEGQGGWKQGATVQPRPGEAAWAESRRTGRRSRHSMAGLGVWKILSVRQALRSFNSRLGKIRWQVDESSIGNLQGLGSN